MYTVRSKSSGVKFGSYHTRKAAEIDADMANAEEKNGESDWEPAEKAGSGENAVNAAYSACAHAMTALKGVSSAAYQAMDRAQDLCQEAMNALRSGK